MSYVKILLIIFYRTLGSASCRWLQDVVAAVEADSEQVGALAGQLDAVRQLTDRSRPPAPAGHRDVIDMRTQVDALVARWRSVTDQLPDRSVSVGSDCN